MNINKINHILQPHLQGQTDSNNASNSANVRAGSAIDASYVNSSLINQLNSSTSESRESLLNVVKAKVQSGAFLTRLQAEATSDAILDQ